MTNKTCRVIRNILCLIAVVVFISMIIWDMVSLTDLWPDKQHAYDTFFQFYVSSRMWGAMAVSFAMSLIPLLCALCFHLRYKKLKAVAVEEKSKSS